MTIEETIAKLTEELAQAGPREAARIRTRIKELKSLKKEHNTT